MSLAALFEEIRTKRDQALLREAGPYPKNQPTASDLGPCARETALGVLHWKQRPAFGLTLLGRLEAGSDAEARILPKLVAYGFTIVEQQRLYELTDDRNRIILRGRIDGKVAWKGQRIPFDLKTVEPLVFPRLRTLEDVLRHPFFRKWPRQLWAYEYLDALATGRDPGPAFLFLENLKGDWRFIEVPFDYGQVDAIVRQCETAMNAIERVRDGEPEDDALPPYFTETTVCRRCWAFGSLCTPPWSTGEGVTIIEDPTLEAKLRRRQELIAAHREYEGLDDEVKETLRGKASALVGNFLVTGKPGTRTYKASEARTVPTWMTTIEPVGTAPIEEGEQL